LYESLQRYKDVFVTLSYAGSASLTLNAQPPKGCATEVPDSTCEVYLHIKGLVDINQERAKLVTKRKSSQDAKDQLRHRMAQPDYVHVPPFVKEQNEEKLVSLDQELSNIDKAIHTLDLLVNEQQ